MSVFDGSGLMLGRALAYDAGLVTFLDSNRLVWAVHASSGNWSGTGCPSFLFTQPNCQGDVAITATSSSWGPQTPCSETVNAGAPIYGAVSFQQQTIAYASQRSEAACVNASGTVTGYLATKVASYGTPLFGPPLTVH